MERRTVCGTVLGAVLLSILWGADGWAKSRLIRRISGAQASPSTQPTVPILWQPNLRTAHHVALQTRRPILVVVGGERCTYCRKLESETLGVASLATYINAGFVPVHLDFQKDYRAAQILEVEALPTCLILSPEADLLGTVEGFVKAPEFAKALQQSLEFQRTLEAEDAADDGPGR